MIGVLLRTPITQMIFFNQDMLNASDILKQTKHPPSHPRNGPTRGHKKKITATTNKQTKSKPKENKAHSVIEIELLTLELNQCCSTDCETRTYTISSTLNYPVIDYSVDFQCHALCTSHLFTFVTFVSHSSQMTSH